jgi:hypothetical protein
MFRVVLLHKLNEQECEDAILKPITKSNCPIKLDETSVNTIIAMSEGYPYFIQFICREVYDAFLQKLKKGEDDSVPTDEIIRKLDTDFFAGRWNRATDRQRELLSVAAGLNHDEFTVQEIVDFSREKLEKPFGGSHVNQMLVALCNSGLVYKNRHGKYSFAVPLLGKYILRQLEN